MKPRLNKARRLTMWLACALFLGVFANEALAEVHTGYYKADDGGAYYIRQIGDKVYWFGEDPDGAYANVLVGTVSGNKITARWWDVPKGKTQGMGEMVLEIREGGSALVKISSTSPFGTKSWHLAVPHLETVGGVSVPVDYPPPARSRPAGFLGGEQNLTAAWEGDDSAVYYVRETPGGDVVWVAEHRLYDSQPQFTHVFFGKKIRNEISGDWIDVPKGKAASSGTLTVRIKGAQDLQTLAKTGNFQAGEWWRSLPNSLRGFADLHTHPMVNLALGGKLVHGGPDVGSLLPTDADCQKRVRARSIAHALGNDNPTHGGAGDLWLDNPCGDELRRQIIDAFQEANHAEVTPDRAVGYPSFKDWPKWNDITHQKMWVDWVRRAYDGGERVMVALAMNNATIAAGVAGPGDGPTDDKASAELQIKEMISFIRRHNDFMEVAYSPADLRRIVASNKMAIVLGVEIDNIGNFNKVDNVTPTMVEEEIKHLLTIGVRYVFPVHLIDNKFGGTAVYQDVFNLSNYRETGRFWDLECGRFEDKLTYYFKPQDADVIFATIKATKLGMNPVADPPKPPVCPALGHKNSKGVLPLGIAAIQNLMRRGMLIDIDHMSQHMADETIAMAEKVPGGYPLVSGHNDFRSNQGTENNRTDEQLQKLGKLGGMFGLGSDAAYSQVYVPTYVKASQLIGAGRVSFGSDLNGLVRGPRPRANANIYNSSFTMSKTGDKTWDYRTAGVAHYGMLADFLRDLSSQGLGGVYLKSNIMKNAEMFAQMWEKAIKNGKGI